MKQFVAYANPKYFNILITLVKSHNIYSKVPMIVYIVNKTNENILIPDEFNNYDKITVRYIQSDAHIWACKFLIMIDSIKNAESADVDFIYIDADVIMNYSIDQLFDYSNDDTVPQLTLHPDYSVANPESFKQLPYKCSRDRYAHSGLIWYNKKACDIFVEAFELSKKFYGIGDEIIINYLQCKNGVFDENHFMITHHTFSKRYFNFPRDVVNEHSLGLRRNGSYVSEMSFHMFHGLKERRLNEELLKNLVEFNENRPNSKIYYNFDVRLFEKIRDFLASENVNKINTLGDGFELYERELQGKGIESINLDKFPNFNIEKPEKYQDGFPTDWIVCFDYGNKFPQNMEDTIIKMLDSNSKCGIILTWSSQKYGKGDNINICSNSYIKQKMARFGFTNDIEVENNFRKNCDVGPPRNDLMVFRKNQLFYL